MDWIDKFMALYCTMDWR